MSELSQVIYLNQSIAANNNNNNHATFLPTPSVFQAQSTEASPTKIDSYLLQLDLLMDSYSHSPTSNPFPNASSFSPMTSKSSPPPANIHELTNLLATTQFESDGVARTLALAHTYECISQILLDYSYPIQSFNYLSHAIAALTYLQQEQQQQKQQVQRNHSSFGSSLDLEAQVERDNLLSIRIQKELCRCYIRSSLAALATSNERVGLQMLQIAESTLSSISSKVISIDNKHTSFQIPLSQQQQPQQQQLTELDVLLQIGYACLFRALGQNNLSLSLLSAHLTESPAARSLLSERDLLHAKQELVLSQLAECNLVAASSLQDEIIETLTLRYGSHCLRLSVAHLTKAKIQLLTSLNPTGLLVIQNHIQSALSILFFHGVGLHERSITAAECYALLYKVQPKESTERSLNNSSSSNINAFNKNSQKQSTLISQKSPLSQLSSSTTKAIPSNPLNNSSIIEQSSAELALLCLMEKANAMMSSIVGSNVSVFHVQSATTIAKNYLAKKDFHTALTYFEDAHDIAKQLWDMRLDVFPERYLNAILALANCSLRIGAMKKANLLYCRALRIRADWIQKWERITVKKEKNEEEEEDIINNDEDQILLNSIPERFVQSLMLPFDRNDDAIRRNISLSLTED